MKKIIFIVFSLCFFLKANSQCLYIKNSVNPVASNNNNLAVVTGLLKYSGSCSAGYGAYMAGPYSTAATSSSTIYYPTSYIYMTPYLKFGLTYGNYTFPNTIAFCGASISNIQVPGTFPMIKFDITPVGTTSALLWFHY